MIKKRSLDDYAISPLDDPEDDFNRTIKRFTKNIGMLEKIMVLIPPTPDVEITRRDQKPRLKRK